MNSNLAEEWNYEKNNGLTPLDVLPNSNKKVWWKCGKGHEWQALIADRNNGRGCPYCTGKKVLKGYNDLQTVNPTLAKEWNYDKNGELTPMEVAPNSGKKVWWKCSKGHEWQAIIQNRNRGRGCPICAKEKRSK
ncbi:MAG: zinc-ribbon domain-containing protein [Clostridia bacterium]|nr:zinc-ribbon domain-containing protein [Clostridia bacterium]